MKARENVVEAVALSLFLARRRLRKALLDSCTDSGGDQRREVDLPRAAARFRELPPYLREDGRNCRERAVRLVAIAASGGIEAVAWSDSRYPPPARGAG